MYVSNKKIHKVIKYSVKSCTILTDHSYDDLKFTVKLSLFFKKNPE